MLLTESEKALEHEYGTYTELAEKLGLCADKIAIAKILDAK